MRKEERSMKPQMPYAVNCSILFSDLPLLQRAAAARQAGFAGIEFWWPYATAVPDDREVDEFVRSIEDAGVQLVNLNLFAGDMAAGDRGLISWPGRSSEFDDNLAVVAAIGERLGCKAFNALYGNRIDGVAAECQDELAAEQLVRAAHAVAHFDGTILVEPLSGMPSYPLRTSDDAFAVIDRADRSNIALLCDLYHLAVNGDALDEVISTRADRIGHVQIADAPGRGKPGSGSLPIEHHLANLAARGYSGWVALEYLSCGSAEDDFDWLASGLHSSTA